MELSLSELEAAGRAHYGAHNFKEAERMAKELFVRTGDVRFRLLEANCAYHAHDALRAHTIIEESVRLGIDHETYHALSAQYLRALGRFSESREHIESVAPTTPGYYSIHGWHLLRDGKFREGMGEIEREPGIYREETRYPYPPSKRLGKDESVHDMTILLVLEGGIGDQIASVRFVEILAQRGARVLVECTPRLVSVLSRMKHVENVAPHGTTSSIHYDRFLPAQSAVGILGIDNPKEGISFPYLFPPSTQDRTLEVSLERFAGEQRRIGIHWQGNWEFDWSEMKSPPAHLMLAFQEVGALISIQRDAGENALPKDAHVYDAETGAPSWEHTMATMASLDVVVSNDTSTAHIAGAMGIPTILLIPHAPHYYWASTTKGAGLETTPWYPTLRVARQPRYDDWEGAIERAVAMVRELPMRN